VIGFMGDQRVLYLLDKIDGFRDVGMKLALEAPKNLEALAWAQDFVKRCTETPIAPIGDLLYWMEGTK
jgi:hypothetical protein